MHARKHTHAHTQSLTHTYTHTHTQRDSHKHTHLKTVQYPAYSGSAFLLFLEGHSALGPGAREPGMHTRRTVGILFMEFQMGRAHDVPQILAVLIGQLI